MDTFCNAPISALNDLEGLEGKDFRVGGIVSTVEHRLTKTGRPFGKMVVEDYQGKNEFTLWSDDYIKYKGFLTPGLFLFIEGSVQRKTWGDQNLEFRIRGIELLNEIGVKRTKGLQIKVDAELINDAIIDRIEKVCKEYNGTTPLYLKLRDDRENITLEMLSRKFRVKPNNEMIDKIRKIPDVSVEVVS